jgi:hypothetical protein
LTERENQLFLTGRFTTAIDYARSLHIQFVKETSIPYKAHLLSVVSIETGEAGYTRVPVKEGMVIAAILNSSTKRDGAKRTTASEGFSTARCWLTYNYPSFSMSTAGPATPMPFSHGVFGSMQD